MMAGNWIKFDTSTSDKPEVWSIATSLGIDPDAVVGKLLRVWAWFDDHSEKGNAPIVTRALLDRKVGVTGFVTAMIEAGWMEEKDGVLALPNFDRHNGQTAKNRVLTAKRVAAHKKGNAGGNAKGNAAIVTNALPKEEESRSEKNSLSLSQKDYEKKIDPKLLPHWQRYCDWRLAITGQEIDAIGAETKLMDLERRGIDKAIRDIEFTILKEHTRSILDSDCDYEKQFKERNNRTTSATYTKPTRKRNYE
jgi:hypothetical protein